eukprot:6199868-Pleurochrysis_carterae.AAC.4
MEDVAGRKVHIRVATYDSARPISCTPFWSVIYHPPWETAPCFTAFPKPLRFVCCKELNHRGKWMARKIKMKWSFFW